MKMIYEYCTAECEAMPECTVCHRRKHPRGRDPGLEASSGYCEPECAGSELPPHAGHLWPGELESARRDEASMAMDAIAGALGFRDRQTYGAGDLPGMIERLQAERDAALARVAELEAAIKEHNSDMISNVAGIVRLTAPDDWPAKYDAIPREPAIVFALRIKAASDALRKALEPKHDRKR